MSNTLKSIFWVLVGLIVGALVNMTIITLGPSVIPPPEGVDVTTVEGLQAGIDLMKPKHFIMPFFAHAFGTFVGAFIAARMCKINKLKYALIVGVLFLMGGISMVLSVPSPVWFNVTDLVLAYIPMAWIGGKVGIQYS